jgi:membrane-associated protease RseP (regulator of RpoE activity)
MGGTTSWASPQRLSVGKRVAISVAGPAAGFALAAVVVVFGRTSGGSLFDTELGMYVYGSLLWVNVGWGILNLLPILPLDGGNVLFHTLNAATHGGGERPARIISLVVAVLGVAAALATGQLFAGLLAASFAAINWRGLRALADARRGATAPPV